MSNQSETTEIDLAGKGLNNLSGLKKYESNRKRWKVLNLHNNMLSDISDMPNFLYLTELNISSNRFKYVPSLSALSSLTTLDVSGNMIESVDSLSFLPALKSLKLAYNCVKSLHGLTSANVPKLEYLDLRENPIIAGQYEIQPIGTLNHLQRIAIDTKKIALVALLFTTCLSLTYVDNKTQKKWMEIAASQLWAEAEAAVPAVVVSTPHFDKVKAAMIKSSTAAAVERGTTVPLPRPAVTSPTRIPQYVPPTSPPHPLVYTLDESTQMTVMSDTSDEQHHNCARNLALQRCLHAHHARLHRAKTTQLTRAFRQFRENALTERYAAAAKQLKQAHTLEIHSIHTDTLNRTHEATQAQAHFTATMKHQQEEFALKEAQLEALLRENKADLGSEREKYAALRLSHAQLQHTLEEVEETTQRQLADQEIKLRALEGLEARNREQHEITLRELETALSESSATIEKLRFELAYCKERLSQSDDRIGNTQQAVASAQYEKAEYYARALALEKQLALEKDHYEGELKELLGEKTQLTASLAAAQQEASTRHSDHLEVLAQREKAEQRLRQLHAAFEALQADLTEQRAENAQLKERDAKNVAALKEVTRGARKLQEIIEMRKHNCEKCAQHDKQLRALHDDRAEDLRVCEKVKASLQHTVEQLSSLQTEHRAKTTQLADATAKVTTLQSQVESLQTRLSALHQEDTRFASPPAKSTSTPHRTPNKSATPNSERDRERLEKIDKLETALKVKDTMLNDQAAELSQLRTTLHEQGVEFKACRRDFGDLEDRYEHAKRDVRELDEQCAELKAEIRHLRQELSRRSDAELKLKALIAEFQQVDPLQGTTVVNKQLFTSGHSGDLHSQHSHSHSEYSVSSVGVGMGVGVLHEKADFSIHPGRKLVCVSPQCMQEKERLQHEVDTAALVLAEQKTQHERMYRVKDEECAKFAQALTQLEANSVDLAGSIRSEKEKFESAIEKYRSDKRKLQRQCQRLEEDLQHKDAELSRAHAAAEQLQGAFANFQKIGLVTK